MKRSKAHCSTMTHYQGAKAQFHLILALKTLLVKLNLASISGASSFALQSQTHVHPYLLGVPKLPFDWSNFLL